jgi:hypothetical protein
VKDVQPAAVKEGLAEEGDQEDEENEDEEEVEAASVAVAADGAAGKQERSRGRAVVDTVKRDRGGSGKKKGMAKTVGKLPTKGMAVAARSVSNPHVQPPQARASLSQSAGRQPRQKVSLQRARPRSSPPRSQKTAPARRCVLVPAFSQFIVNRAKAEVGGESASQQEDASVVRCSISWCSCVTSVPNVGRVE